MCFYHQSAASQVLKKKGFAHHVTLLNITEVFKSSHHRSETVIRLSDTRQEEYINGLHKSHLVDRNMMFYQTDIRRADSCVCYMLDLHVRNAR